MYWTTNNAFSIAQTLIMKQESVRSFLQIPKLPPPEKTPPLKLKNPLATFVEAAKKEMNPNTHKAEIVDGKSTAPPPPPGPPPVTFASRPPTKPKAK
jgi:membrane protein insertase Oxa1/YidC/SpoIIIJ